MSGGGGLLFSPMRSATSALAVGGGGVWLSTSERLGKLGRDDVRKKAGDDGRSDGLTAGWLGRVERCSGGGMDGRLTSGSRAEMTSESGMTSVESGDFSKAGPAPGSAPDESSLGSSIDVLTTCGMEPEPDPEPEPESGRSMELETSTTRPDDIGGSSGMSHAASRRVARCAAGISFVSA